METKTATTPKSRGGRPPKKAADRKTVEVKVYLTPKQKTQLQQRQKKAGYRHLAAYMSDAALNGQTAPEAAISLPPEITSELGIIGKNINQLAKHKNSGGDWHPSFNEELADTRRVVWKLYQYIVESRRKSAGK
jgi:hypothetical protein